MNQQLFIMNILPEEDITGFIVRQSFERNQVRALMKPENLAESTERPGWAFPSGLSSLTNEIQIALPDTDGVISKHTRFPLYSRFLSDEDAQALRKHYVGTAMKGVAAHVGMSSRAFRSRMAVCPECIQTDIRDNGYAFWRRLHLTPGITACATHKRPLLTFCDACEAAHRRNRTNWLPPNRCLCGGSLKVIAELKDKEHEAAVGVATLAEQVLQGTVSTKVSSATVSALLERLFAKPKAKNGRRPYALFEELLHETVGAKFATHVGIGTTTLKRMVGALKSGGLIRNPIQYLAAIYAVFGDFDGFEAALQTNQETAETDGVIDVGLRPKKRRKREPAEYKAWVKKLTPTQNSSLRMESRTWLLERLHESPALQRSELYDLPGSDGPLRYLRLADKAWFDSILPPLDARRIRVARERQHVQEVVRLKNHIFERYELSIKTQPMERVTKTYLISHAGCESRGNRALESEEIQTMLEMYSETPAQRRRRVMAMVCQEVRTRAPDHPLGAESTYIDLNDNCFASRLSRAKKWLAQNAK
ncbi:TniQ family protein [Pseudoduganella sp. R-31]|uniref:TniQ family protein n=1 Tax=Pseudoduganella sp. R-31 TaxID=3404060 RepID=UPI003CF341F7